MKKENKKVCNKITDPDGVWRGDYVIFCPACKTVHVFNKRWTFNNDFNKPTFEGSMLIKENPDYRKISHDDYGHRCHSHVTNGFIKFLGDCTHDMKNQTVELEPF